MPYSITEARRAAIVRKSFEDPTFVITNVSENAFYGLEYNNTINEFQADFFVRKCQGTVSDELLAFMETIENDAIAD